jgi:hypothetical protein
VTVPRHRGTPARICPAPRWPDEDERPDLLDMRTVLRQLGLSCIVGKLMLKSASLSLSRWSVCDGEPLCLVGMRMPGSGLQDWTRAQRRGRWRRAPA